MNDTLQTIETIENAELGFTKKIYSIDEDKIISIKYVGHHAEWGKYQEKYPKEEYEWNPSKMTYFDTSFTVNYALDTTTKSDLSNELKQNGKELIKFIKEITNATPHKSNNIVN